MQENKVIVTADTLGNVIGVSVNNPEYGYIRVEQTANQISEGGWLKIVKRSALIKGKVEDLKSIGYKAGDVLLGNIVTRESLTPFNSENPDRDLKIAGNTGVVCTVDDQPIYRNTFFTNNPYTVDEFIQHTNTEEIKNAQNAQRAIADLTHTQPVEL